MGYIDISAVINMSMEFVAVCVLMILLFSCATEKKKTKLEKAYLISVGNMFLVVLIEDIYWGMKVWGFNTIEHPGGFLLVKILLILDYFFCYTNALCFLKYLAAAVQKEQPLDDKNKKIVTVSYNVIFISCLICTLLYASSMWNGWFYKLENNGMFAYTNAYWILLGFSAICPIYDLIFIFLNRKTLGKRRTIYFMIYFLMPFLLMPVDILYSLCLSYISMALELVVIYIGIHVQQRQELLQNEARIARHEVEMINMRVNLMMTQIHPHFLYNTLSSISYLCISDPHEARAAINDFASYLRSNLYSINSDLPILFEMELKHVESYLNIQKRRFMERLQVEYEIKSKDFLIPALTLQPIVENCVHHVVETRFEPTLIQIITRETEDTFEILVKDDGPGFKTEQSKKEDRPHVGIKSTRIRLKEMVDGNLTISSEYGKGTTVTITIPKKKSEDQKKRKNDLDLSEQNYLNACHKTENGKNSRKAMRKHLDVLRDYIGCL